jgi:hypothetical protein
MALTVPLPSDLYLFWGSEADDTDDVRATAFLDLATNLMWLAIELEVDPADVRLKNLVKYAIIDMAIYMWVSRDDIDASYSPFTTERVGSYSYSKLARAVTQGIDTGVPIFDRVVLYYKQLSMSSGSGWTTSEAVFDQGYVPLRLEAWFMDPIWSGSRGWITWGNLMSGLSDQEFINQVPPPPLA